ncbi:ABC transporter, NBP/MSD fusion protein, partial [mine drainage metagenome]
LISRLYDPDAGEISLDGINLREISLQDLSDHIGVVSQETFLFHDTVASNLRFARPDATNEELIAATKGAQIYQTIMEMPDGFDTLVGERGYRLSGGERQRLAIARVFLKKPEIVILDEATSHLDTENEAAVQSALFNLLSNRTSIVIAHRLST